MPRKYVSASSSGWYDNGGAVPRYLTDDALFAAPSGLPCSAWVTH
jgi:hypothetical protein